MMIRTQRERRIVALGLLAGVLLVIWVGVVMPLVDGFQFRAAERDRLLMAHARNAQMIADLPALRKRYDAQQRENQHLILTVNSDLQASQLVKERLTQILSQLGADLKSMEDLGTEKQSARISLRARMTLSQLIESLYQIQNKAPVLIIDVLKISADEAFSTGRLSPMDIHLEISAPYTLAAPR